MSIATIMRNEKIKYWRSKGFLICLSMIIFGLLMILFSGNKGELLTSFVSQVGSILLISGAWSILYETSLRCQFFDAIDEHLQVLLELKQSAEQQKTTGLVNIYQDTDTYDFRQAISENIELRVFITTGRSFISKFYHDFVKRFQDSNKITVFILTHPSSPAIDNLAFREKKSAAKILEKIKSSVDYIKDMPGYSSQHVKIFGHKTLPSCRAILGDDKVYITFFQLSPGRRPLPLFVFENSGENSFFSIIKNDISSLEAMSDDISCLGEHLQM